MFLKHVHYHDGTLSIQSFCCYIMSSSSIQQTSSQLVGLWYHNQRHRINEIDKVIVQHTIRIIGIISIHLKLGCLMYNISYHTDQSFWRGNEFNIKHIDSTSLSYNANTCQNVNEFQFQNIFTFVMKSIEQELTTLYL